MEASHREQKCAGNLQQEESEADFYKRCAGNMAGCKETRAQSRESPADYPEPSWLHSS